MTQLAKDLGISRRRLGRFFAGLDVLTPTEAVAAMEHELLDGLGLTYADFTGVQIPEGTLLGAGLVATRATRRDADHPHTAEDAA